MSMALLYWGAQNWTHVWPPKCRVEEKDPLPWLAGNILSKAAQDTISPLSSKGTLLAHVQLGVHQDSQMLFCQAAFQLGDLFSMYWCLALFSSQLQDFSPC